MESERNKRLAAKSYEKDVFDKTASNKDKKQYKKDLKTWNKSVKKNRIEIMTKTMVETKYMTDKFNKILDKEKLVGEEYFDSTKMDSAKSKRYAEITNDYYDALTSKQIEIAEKVTGVKYPNIKNYQKRNRK